MGRPGRRSRNFQFRQRPAKGPQCAPRSARGPGHCRSRESVPLHGNPWQRGRDHRARRRRAHRQDGQEISGSRQIPLPPAGRSPRTLQDSARAHHHHGLRVRNRAPMPITQGEITGLDLAWVRAQFPALRRTLNGHAAVFLDAPGGTQVPQRVIDAIGEYLKGSNANTHGAFDASERTDAVIGAARAAMADLFACDRDEIVFGANMTSLTYAFSRALGREIEPGDEILLTQLDHDANVSPWRALEERGAVVRFVDINEHDCTLDMNDLAGKITNRTKIVAACYASNAVGTINPVKEICRRAHQAGALVYIDAVHYAPHGPIDVRDLDCDFLVASSYKFFGPHMGVLYGKREHLTKVRPYKVRANTNAIPNRWEWG